MERKVIEIVLPVYKPYEGWEQVLQEKYDLLRMSLSQYDFKLILVDDGTPWDITEAMQFIKYTYPDSLISTHEVNCGKGQALRTGMNHAEGEMIVFTDYDFPYKVESMVSMIDQFAQGGMDIATASRDESYYQNIPVARKWISTILKKTNQMLLRLPVADTQGGLKMLNSEAKKVLLDTKIDRYLIDIEFLKKAHRKGLKITPIIVELREEIMLTNVSNLRILKELQAYLKILTNAI